MKNIPILGGGFETETELTIKALAHGYRIVERPVDLKARPAGSFSKIRIIQDGFLILSSILTPVSRLQAADVLWRYRIASGSDRFDSGDGGHCGVH